jgi:hypothetical protein
MAVATEFCAVAPDSGAADFEVDTHIFLENMYTPDLVSNCLLIPSVDDGRTKPSNQITPCLTYQHQYHLNCTSFLCSVFAARTMIRQNRLVTNVVIYYTP